MVINDWKMDVWGHKGLGCTPPCDMYSVLLENGYISDPYYGTNEEELLALSKQGCTFYSSFSLGKEELKREKIEITFLGLDTICTIYLNGAKLDTVMNMHRAYTYDVKGIARAENELRLEFDSPVEYFEKMEAEHHLYTNWDTVQGAAHLRKALYMSGWDWAPTLPNMGIFRPVIINAYDCDKFEDTEIIQSHENGKVTLTLKASTRHSAKDVEITGSVDNQSVTLENGEGKIIIENPRLWWPRGYGEQNLYEVTFRLYKDGNLIDTVVKNVGLRTLILCRENDADGEGQEFCFSVNGVKIFAMGANLVPMDSLPSRLTEQRMEGLIKDCVFANFNCIRVWGGAFYPDDYFYDLCDKYGLMVWQDFMMACSNVWLRPEFEREFVAEAIYNTKRIRHHACLGVLCGNNEMEEAICNWPCADGTDPQVRADYLKLYEDILPKICAEHAPYIPYTPSSPTSGGNFDNPTDNTRGDVHFWHVWNGNCGFDEYRKHKFRFCSEYGFESLPSIKTIYAFCPPEERNLLSYTMEKHQKHVGGNVKLLRYLGEQYRQPSSIEATAYATQLNQANAIKYGVEHFRRNRGYTMGSIYWQLNDCWPVASWSSIDYFGRYKALHYFARNFYAPVALGLFSENGKVALNVANETMNDFVGTVRYGVRRNDFTFTFEAEKEISVKALSSKDVAELTSRDFDGLRDMYFYAELYDQKGNLIAVNTELGCKPKHFKFLNPEIKVEIEKTGDTAVFTVSSKRFAKNVELSLANDDIVFSDNYFDLPTEKPYKVYAVTNLTKEELEKQISTMSVYDI